MAAILVLSQWVKRKQEQYKKIKYKNKPVQTYSIKRKKKEKKAEKRAPHDSYLLSIMKHQVLYIGGAVPPKPSHLAAQCLGQGVAIQSETKSHMMQ